MRRKFTHRFLCAVPVASLLLGCTVSSAPIDDADEVSSIDQSVNGNCPANYHEFSIHLDNDGGPQGPGAGRFISGWAFDNNDPDSSVVIHLDTGGLGYEWQCASFVANQQRDDVNNYCGVSGVHGFSFVVPDSCNQREVGITIDGRVWFKRGVNWW
jgi:hypothetical protein